MLAQIAGCLQAPEQRLDQIAVEHLRSQRAECLVEQVVDRLHAKVREGALEPHQERVGDRAVVTSVGG